MLVKGPDFSPYSLSISRPSGQAFDVSLSLPSEDRDSTWFLTSAAAGTHDPGEGDSAIYRLGGFIKARLAPASSVS